MNSPNLTTYKYHHADKQPLPLPYKLACGIAVVLVLLSAYFSPPVSFFLLCFVIVASIVAAPSKSIRLSPRYLVCGRTIIYYRNIDKIIMDEGNGYLALYWGSGQAFRIDRDKFPTAARKTHKIAANKAAKFSRIAEKIIAKTRAVTPTVTIIGATPP